MAVDMFLKIDGIPGESTDDRHKDEIDILSYAWGESQLGTGMHERAGRYLHGKMAMQDFHFAMRVSKASPR